MEKYVVGIDLHGTLLDKQWEVKKELRKELATSLNAIKDFCKIYICSGNDLTFVNKYIPSELRECFDGYVLETGCVISEGEKEKIIIPENLTKMIKELEKNLKEKNIKEIKYFGRRLITIALFTRDEKEGIDPREIHPTIEKLVNDLGYGEEVLVTHSSVAIDILPKDYNKFTGIKHIANGLKTIGIADSLNDLHLISKTDFAFMPNNASPKLIELLESEGKKIMTIEKNNYVKNTVLKSKHGYTKGVIDSLNFINKYLRDQKA